MDAPLDWEFESDRHRGDDFCDFEWSMALGCQLSRAIGQREILPFEPYELSY
jgi:hypothetical protein